MTLSLVSRTAVCGLAAAGLSFSAAQAAAPRLVSMSPGPADGYTPIPKQIRMTFDQPPAPAGLQVSILDPDGRRIRVGQPVRAGDNVSVTTGLTDLAVAGPYLVSWQASSASGEQAKGDYSFFVKP